MKYRTEIDGLRAVAVTSVILTHAGLTWLPGGFVGVDIFFVISGYLITLILMAEMAEGRFSLVRFYERRARRILPALVVMVLVCLPLAWVLMLPWQLKEFSDSVVAVALFLSNVEFWRQSGYFASESAAKPLLHTWSLGVEEQFYLAFPLLLLILYRMGRVGLVAAISALALVSLAASEWGWRHHPDANFYLIPFRAWQLLAGVLAALIGGEAGRGPHNLLSGLGLAMIAFSIVIFTEATPFPSVYALVPVVGTAIVLLYGGSGSVVSRLLSVRPFVMIGLFSYSAYLWHQPLFAFARIYTLFEPPPALMAVLAVASLGLGWLSWRYVERPFRRRPVPLVPQRRKLFALAGSSLLLLALLGAGLRAADEAGLRPARWDGITEAQRKALEAGRNAGIRMGTCHFGLGVNVGIDAFLKAWSCVSGDEPELVPLQAGIFGDSHAADKAAAIRAGGFDIAQMTGAGCPLVSVDSLHPECAALRAAFDARMQADGIDTVFLANDMSAEETTPAYLQAVIDEWTARYRHVYLFAPMPEFLHFDEFMQVFGAKDRQSRRPDTAQIDTFRAALQEVDLKGVTVIDTYRLFCPDPATCAPDDGDILMVDAGHLSAAGALKFGKRLVAESGLPFAAAKAR